MARQWTNCFNSSNVHEPISKCRATLGLRIFYQQKSERKSWDWCDNCEETVTSHSNQVPLYCGSSWALTGPHYCHKQTIRWALSGEFSSMFTVGQTLAGYWEQDSYHEGLNKSPATRPHTSYSYLGPGRVHSYLWDQLLTRHSSQNPGGQKKGIRAKIGLIWKFPVVGSHHPCIFSS